MDSKSLFNKYGIHVIAIFSFLIVSYMYFSPQVKGYGIKQHDVEQFKGMSNEVVHYREVAQEEPLWTNSMFGGMPTTQISTDHKGNIIKQITNTFLKLFPIPLGVFLLHLISFYLLSVFLRIKPIIGVLGAFAFAFASYEIIILQAGHNTKAIAVAFLPAVLGAFIYAFQRNWKWGALLSGLIMTFELSANHLQVTYYMVFLLFGMGVYFLIKAIQDKQIKQFAITAGSVIGGYLIALFINYGNIAMTNDYAKHTIRGANDLTIAADGTALESGDGLNKDYITQWSYGKGESFTLISPYIMGSHSGGLQNSGFADISDDVDLSSSEYKGATGMPLYWGEQPITSGPVYIGVVILFLALLAMIFVKDRSKWVLLAISVLALVLSWGKNFMGFTEFFIDNVPGYDKFRTVTIILVLVELCMPILAILLLQQLYDNREKIKEQKKTFLIVSGVFLVFLLGYKFTGGDSSFSGSGDDRIIENTRDSYMRQIERMDPTMALEQYRLDINNKEQVSQFVEANMEDVYAGLEGVKKVRREIFKKSTTRSVVLGIFAIGICALFFYTSLPSIAIVAGLLVLTLIDLVPVDRNYLGTLEDEKGNYIHWQPIDEKAFPIKAVVPDYQIMEAEVTMNPSLQAEIDKGEKRGRAKSDELGYDGAIKKRIIDSYKFQALGMNTNYRVFDYNGGWSSSRASYFHKSLGGYHGAKLRNIQNLFDFQIALSNNEVFNMLNVKYFIQVDQLRPNPNALGNAWAVKKVSVYDSPNDEIRALGKKFKLTNVGPGKLVVNDENKASAEVYGAENLGYVVNGDTAEVLMSNAIENGMNIFLVADVKGKTTLMRDVELAIDTLNSFTKYVSYEVVDNFKASEEAVMLKEYADKLSKKEFTGEAAVKLTSYKPNHMKYDVAAKGSQLIVFSEIYYPDGWTAFVDGKEQEILKVDYLLRGLEVKEGKHTVEFKFDIPKYHSSQTMSSIGSILLLLLLAGFGYLEFRNRKKVSEESASTEE